MLEMLTRVGQRLLVVEGRIRLEPNVTMALPPATAPLSHPGMIGLGADGNLRIEPLPGGTVLAAGRNVVLELHLVSTRLNLSEQAMASCPCLTPPATCHLVSFDNVHKQQQLQPNEAKPKKKRKEPVLF